jgi:hypothetical protein
MDTVANLYRTYKGLAPGDVVAFATRHGRKTGAVIHMLAFADHVVVRHGPCGTSVDDSNFIKLVRRARR